VAVALAAVTLVRPTGAGRAAAGRHRPAHQRWQEIRKPAGDATFRRLQGSELRLDELAGKVVVLDFWTTWCEPCRQEVPELAAFDDWARSRGDVALVTVNEDEDAAALARFLDRHRPRFTIVLPGNTGALEITGYPTKLLVGRDGSLRLRKLGGPVAFEELRDRAEALLRVPAPH